MDIEVRPCSSLEELRDGLNAVGHYFGFANELEDAERFAQWIDVRRVHVALDADRVVGGAGAFTYRMSVPGGGSVPAAGTTVVGVLPTHRRRGILTAMMRAQLDDARARGDLAACLWASEGTIYGRFGFGLASRTGAMTLAGDRAAFAAPFEPRGAVRLLELEEAAELFPPLYEQAFAQRPGMMSRTDEWWRTRRLYDNPASRQGGPKHRALLELDGVPAGYAIYKVKQDWRGGSGAGSVQIVEAVAATSEAVRELWRWLFDFDWTEEFKAEFLPLDHELFQLLAEPRRMNFAVSDGIWVRLIDVGGALSARTYTDGEIVLEVEDSFLPENAGHWRVTSDGVERTGDDADLRLDSAGLGSLYLGGFSFRELVRGSRARELTPDAAARADAIFRTNVQPWCAEIF
jgi:predicted acetyltransferase